MLWDIFCRVIDNHGDAGVCWRLAADLAGRGEQVRLCIDDRRALAWMAPHGAAGVEIADWSEAGGAESAADVVVEAFGCELPSVYRQALFDRQPAPVWIDLEYLSAEPFALRSHGLPSPQFDAAARRLDKWFFFPGFAETGGGLLREPELAARQTAFDADRWLASHGVARRPGERIVSLFCYQTDRLNGLLDALAVTPTLLLASAGSASDATRHALAPAIRRGALRAVCLPLVEQADFDHLLWSCDLNFVRGEDSFVRAQWAARPFVWQLYPQHDGAHHAKLDAFLALFLEHANGALADEVRTLFEFWNGLANPPAAGDGGLVWPDERRWRAHCSEWASGLAAPPSLTPRLLEFVHERR